MSAITPILPVLEKIKGGITGGSGDMMDVVSGGSGNEWNFELSKIAVVAVEFPVKLAVTPNWNFLTLWTIMVSLFVDKTISNILDWKPAEAAPVSKKLPVGASPIKPELIFLNESNHIFTWQGAVVGL